MALESGQHSKHRSWLTVDWGLLTTALTACQLRHGYLTLTMEAINHQLEGIRITGWHSFQEHMDLLQTIISKYDCSGYVESGKGEEGVQSPATT